MVAVSRWKFALGQEVTIRGPHDEEWQTRPVRVDARFVAAGGVRMYGVRGSYVHPQRPLRPMNVRAELIKSEAYPNGFEPPPYPGDPVFVHANLPEDWLEAVARNHGGMWHND